MHPDPNETARSVSLPTYGRLAACGPVERTELVLQLIQNHPQGRLELPICDGQPAILNEVQLGYKGLQRRVAPGTGAPAWWSSDTQGVCLKGARLQGAHLTLADLQCADLREANLRGARLSGVNFTGAVLGSANLEEAVLTDTRLVGVDLSRCNIARVFLRGAWLEKTRLRQEQLGPAVGDELAGRYEDARLAYLALERNFVEIGDPGAASWAYRRKRRMEKLNARSQARA